MLMAISIEQWKLIRWFGWAVICLFITPEMTSVVFWINSPTKVVESLTLYFVFGVVLEIIYRQLAWGGMTIRKHNMPAIAPDCPGNPWIPIFFHQPPENGNFEVFCFDGKIRSAKSAGKVGDKLVIYVDYEAEVVNLKDDNPWVFRPMQWRHFK
jgi:hypothetical protein